ncbi:hypothetical protein ACJJTC_014014 [Scirpophaga incertulas]
MNDVKADIRSTKESLQDLKSKWADMENRFACFEHRLSAAEEKLLVMPDFQKEIMNAKEMISSLKAENDAQDQFSRQNNIEISGIPVANAVGPAPSDDLEPPCRRPTNVAVLNYITEINNMP